jgi:HAD superfamily hydrolase (TIGR01450 family)
VRTELHSLPPRLADTVARHLVAAGRAVDEDPAGALAHAVTARRLASRIGAVREAVGLAAYHAGEWQLAIAELRTYHRISGRQTHLAVVADCERALGRSERAIDLHRTADRDQLAPAEFVELLIVAAGARRDLGQQEAAVAMLQVPELAEEEAPWAARLRYAYADALLDAGRAPEAREWFARAAAADEQVRTDAAERLLDLDGVVLEEAPEEDGRLVDGYDLVILDLDGVVYTGEEPIPGAVEAIDRLAQEGPPVVFVTNNASRGADEVAALLAGLGVAATPADVLTSAAVAAEVLAQRLPPDAPVLVVGTDALADEVRRTGLRPVRSADDQPRAVVQGYGPRVGWAELAEAYLAIRAGGWWVVTNTDRTLPSPRGILPGNGALVAALATALEREPDVVVGKPHPQLFTAAARHAGASTPLVVGDRLDTDIEGAHRAGLDSLLVLTGVDSEAEAVVAPAQRRPTYLGADLAALFVPAAPLPSAPTEVFAA